MSVQCYKEITFQKQSLKMIEILNTIIADYIDQGFRLTVRQLYYQCVARDLLANNERNYQNLISLVNNARIAGLMDWDAIEDRTRAFSQRGKWDSPAALVEAAARGYHTDPWATQDVRVFAVVEKEALAGVFEDVCWRYDVPLLAARGYPSASVLREFAERHLVNVDTTVHILHFGDHDPSGIDMTRDLIDRMELFSYGGADFEVHRLALNYDQIEEHRPPPNPAKMTDSRFVKYRQRFGDKSWELDALSPTILNGIIEERIKQYIDEPQWEKWARKDKKDRARIAALAKHL